MNATYRPAASAALLTLAVAAPAVAAIHSAAQPIDGRFIAVLRDEAVRPAAARATDDPRPSVAQLASELGQAHRLEVGRRYGHALAGFAFGGDRAAAETLAADARVAYVAEDGWVEVAGEQSAPPSWGLDRADQRPVSLDARYLYYADGAGIDLYIVDTGIRSTHAEFAGRIGAGYTTVADGNGTEDCAGHGTHVAGIAAGTTYGVAKAATLHSVRVLDCGGRGTVSQIIAGVDWITARYPTPTGKNAVKPPTRAVANLSFATAWHQALDDAVARSIAAGVTYVAAAGNGGADACGISPARTAAAITVGASDAADARASFSNYGSCIDLFAPGASIVSSFAAGDTDLLTMSGTSMAAPHVAGTAALALSVNASLTPAQVQTLVVAAASTEQLAGIGAGSPNRLLYAPFTGAGLDMAPVATFTASCLSGTCTFDAAGSADDRGIVSYAWNLGAKSASGVKVSYKYARATKSATVTLTVTDTTGKKTSAQQTVQTGN